MLLADYCKYTLHFKRPSGTSRGVLFDKDSWFIRIRDTEQPGKEAIGECGVLASLSVDDPATYEDKLREVCERINEKDALLLELVDYPSIRFGLEMALKSWESDDPFLLFPSDFTSGKEPQLINGLIWMGSADFMHQQIREKLDANFHCIKMKIGAIEFEQEMELLKGIRKQFSADDIELRVDANGAFAPDESDG